MLPLLASLAILAGPSGRALDQQQLAALGKGEILTNLVDVPGSAAPRGTAVAIVDAPPAEVYTVFTDYRHFAEFMPYVSSVRIDRVAPPSTTVSFTLDLPLLGDRRYQLQYLDSPHELMSQWRYTGVGDINEATGSIVVAPFGDGRRSIVRYTVVSDPGGHLPDFIKRRVARPGMKKVLEAVRERVRARSYR